MMYSSISIYSVSLVWFGRVNYSIVALDSEPLLVKPGSLQSKMFCSLNNQYEEINIIRVTQSFILLTSYQSEQGLTCSLYLLKEGGGGPLLPEKGTHRLLKHS